MSIQDADDVEDLFGMGTSASKSVILANKRLLMSIQGAEDIEHQCGMETTASK